MSLLNIHIQAWKGRNPKVREHFYRVQQYVFVLLKYLFHISMSYKICTYVCGEKNKKKVTSVEFVPDF